MPSSNVVLQPYKQESQSAKSLANRLSQLSSLRVRRLLTEGSTFVLKPRNVVINWGLSTAPSWYRHGIGRVVNAFDKVKLASNKLETFNVLRAAGDISIPEYTADRETAIEWVNRGVLVVCRTKLTGHSGAGIVLAAREEDLPAGCPLFVTYIKKKAEFRVHVAFGTVIDVQQKKQRSDYEGKVDYAVRNHHTGWVYCREGLEPNEALNELAIKSVVALGLDFGAVDIIYNQHHKAYYVLEVNTAPGLEGTSIENYANCFHGELK